MSSKWLSYIFTVTVLTAGLFIILWIFVPTEKSHASIISIASPLPSFLDLKKNNQVNSLTLWSPSAAFITSNTVTQPAITGSSVVSYDLTTDKILYSKSPNAKIPMASLTKIMTAIVALEHPKQDDTYIVRGNDLVGEDSMGLDVGEKLSLRELLYGMILHSGNDAAMTFADNYPDGIPAFINAMNAKAQALGLTNTHFTNPSGLEGDGTQYTTAIDLLVMTRYALQFPLFSEVAATPSYLIAASSTHKEYDLQNETNLLTTYPGVKGIKTGYTPEAGLCLVTYLDYGNHKILAVLLGSENRRQDMKDILDYSLSVLGVIPPKHD